MMYAGFSKIIWAAAICWIILSCSTEPTGISKMILESKVLLPFSRLSYSAYLVNPLIIMMLILCTEFPLLLDITSLVSCAGRHSYFIDFNCVLYFTFQFYTSFGIFWIVIYVSIGFMMCIENPYTMMVRTFIEGKA